jgi:hypothetical protein
LVEQIFAMTLTAKDWIVAFIGITIYSGPLIPLSAVLVITRNYREPFGRALRALVILLLIQASSFLPYMVGTLNNRPDVIKRLLLPYISGLLMLIATSLYAFVEALEIRIFKSREYAPEPVKTAKGPRDTSGEDNKPDDRMKTEL